MLGIVLLLALMKSQARSDLTLVAAGVATELRLRALPFKAWQ